jgi:hypothetical protein
VASVFLYFWLQGYGYRDLGGLSLFFYLIFAYVPKLITFSEREDPYGLLNPKDCKPILSDLPVLISTPLGELSKLLLCFGKAVEPCLSRLRQHALLLPSGRQGTQLFHIQPSKVEPSTGRTPPKGAVEPKGGRQKGATACL